ncbi:MAG: TIGR02301 family protein [Rhodobiaceae bacterium]|nr:TIGR02301 family protein [Rhodobiaceae bacterium]
MRSNLFIRALVVLCLTGLPAVAQEEVEQRPPEPEQKAPYEDELLRLAEVMGSVHYLSALCAPKAKSVWRDRMSELILTEKPAEPLKAQLVTRFNRGYETYSLTYRSCTQSARLALDRYGQEGAKLARDIADRYGS